MFCHLGKEIPSEVIRSLKALMKHTLMRSGSRDTSTQLFLTPCRGLGILALHLGHQEQEQGNSPLVKANDSTDFSKKCEGKMKGKG